ncbi:MAG: hypothetical protein V4490_05605 [Pseudomonadota bacterium]
MTTPSIEASQEIPAIVSEASPTSAPTSEPTDTKAETKQKKTSSFFKALLQAPIWVVLPPLLYPIELIITGAKSIKDGFTQYRIKEAFQNNGFWISTLTILAAVALAPFLLTLFFLNLIFIEAPKATFNFCRHPKQSLETIKQFFLGKRAEEAAALETENREVTDLAEVTASLDAVITATLEIAANTTTEKQITTEEQKEIAVRMHGLLKKFASDLMSFCETQLQDIYESLRTQAKDLHNEEYAAIGTDMMANFKLHNHILEMIEKNLTKTLEKIKESPNLSLATQSKTPAGDFDQLKTILGDIQKSQENPDKKLSSHEAYQEKEWDRAKREYVYKKTHPFISYFGDFILNKIQIALSELNDRQPEEANRLACILYATISYGIHKHTETEPFPKELEKLASDTSGKESRKLAVLLSALTQRIDLEKTLKVVSEDVCNAPDTNGIEEVPAIFKLALPKTFYQSMDTMQAPICPILHRAFIDAIKTSARAADKWTHSCGEKTNVERAEAAQKQASTITNG